MGTEYVDFIFEALEICNKARKCVIQSGSSSFFLVRPDYCRVRVYKNWGWGISCATVFFAVILLSISSGSGGVVRLEVLGGGGSGMWLVVLRARRCTLTCKVRLLVVWVFMGVGNRYF